MKNFEQHRTRLTQVATVLEDAGLKLGLEYVGPKTLMARDKYPFLHSSGGLRELIEATGKNNIGYLLDSYHTYCAEDKNEDLFVIGPSSTPPAPPNPSPIFPSIDSLFPSRYDMSPKLESLLPY